MHPDDAPQAGDTLALLDLWFGGDTNALEQLLERELPWIRRKVESRLGPGLRKRVEGSDIVQEAMIKVLRYVPRCALESKAQFRTLMAKVIENVIRTHLEYFNAGKRQAVERPIERDTMLYLDPPRASVGRPSTLVQRQQELDWIEIAMSLLADSDRHLLLARRWERQSFEQIATSLGIGPDAARMRFNRAVERLGSKVKLLREGRIDHAVADLA